MASTYYKNLDGVRGYAVMMVLLFHTKLMFFWYGWVGVQIFFVLSGFLLTNILIENRGSSNFFQVFYFRRALRIFPIYYTLLIVTLLFCLKFNIPKSDLVYYFAYLQNYILEFLDWSIKAPPFLDHTWSLAVEEQFYLFLPAIIYFLNSRNLTVFMIFLVILSILVKLVLVKITPGSPIIWANTFSCLDFLLMGSLLSIYRDKP